MNKSQTLVIERHWTQTKMESLKSTPWLSFDFFCVLVFASSSFAAAAVQVQLLLGCVARAEASSALLLLLGGSCVIAVLFVAWLLADAFSGFVHFLADQILSPSLYFFGPRFVVPFREHHDEPQGLLQHSFFERSGNNCAVSTLLPLIILCHYFISRPVSDTASTALLTWYCCLYGIGLIVSLLTAFTNEFHAWAHRDENPAWILKLQRWGVVLPPSHHDQHHSGNLDSHYCITSGISERLFWRLKRIGQLPLFKRHS